VFIFNLTGVDRLNKDIEMMTGSNPGILWKIVMCITTPLIIIVRYYIY